MGKTYIDLAIVSHSNGDGAKETHLFCAPAWSHFEKGDAVICDTPYGKRCGTVIDSITVDTLSNDFSFIITGMGETTPLRRLLSKVRLQDLDYGDCDSCVEYVHTEGETNVER